MAVATQERSAETGSATGGQGKPDLFLNPQFDRAIARDRSLIRRAQDGDSSAVDQIYNYYRQLVYNHCLRIAGNPNDAVELTQDTFLNFFRRLNHLDPERIVLHSYLVTIARNASFNWIKKRSRTELREDSGHDIFDDGLEVNPERSSLQGEQGKLLVQALGAIPDRQRQALYLKEVEGLSYDTIGSELGVKANAVAQLISRARMSLRGQMRSVSVSWASESDVCDKALKLINRQLDGELKGPDSAWLEEHIGECSSCRENYATMEEAGTSYRSVVPLPAALVGWKAGSSLAAGSLLSRIVALLPTKKVAIICTSALVAAGAGIGVFSALNERDSTVFRNATSGKINLAATPSHRDGQKKSRKRSSKGERAGSGESSPVGSGEQPGGSAESTDKLADSGSKSRGSGNSTEPKSGSSSNDSPSRGGTPTADPGSGSGSSPDPGSGSGGGSGGDVDCGPDEAGTELC